MRKRHYKKMLKNMNRIAIYFDGVSYFRHVGLSMKLDMQEFRYGGS